MTDPYTPYGSRWDAAGGVIEGVGGAPTTPQAAPEGQSREQYLASAGYFQIAPGVWWKRADPYTGEDESVIDLNKLDRSGTDGAGGTGRTLFPEERERLQLENELMRRKLAP